MIFMSIFPHNSTSEIDTSDSQETRGGLFFASFILILLNHISAVISATFCYDPFMNTNVYSSYTTTFQTFTLLHKAILCPVILFSSDPNILKWLFAGLNIVLSLIRFELLFVQTPYYKYSALRLSSILASIPLAISITNLLSNILSVSGLISPLDVLSIEIIAIVMGLYLVRSRLNRLVWSSISTPVDKLKTKEEIFKRIFALTYFADTSNFSLSPVTNRICNQSLLYMMADFSSHKGKCNNQRCLCHYLIEHESNSDLHCKNMFEILKIHNESKSNIQLEVLDTARKVLRRDNIFKILSAHLLAKQSQNYFLSLSQLFTINNRDSNTKEKALIYHLTQRLEEEMAGFFHRSEEKGHLALNIKKTVDFERKLEQMFELVKKSAQLYLELWEYFQEAHISLNEFMKRSMKLEKEAKMINKLWNELTKRGQHLSKYAYILYTSYLSTVRNLPSKADKIYMKYITQEQYLTKDEERIVNKKIDDAGDIIFYMSVSRERLGRILYVSRNIYEELGWLQADVINQNIKKVQAPFIKEKHDQILLNHIDGAKTSTIISFHGFAQSGKGYIVPVSGNITIFPYIEKEPVYAGIIRKKEVGNEFMIVRASGAVDSFSEGISKELELVPNQKLHLGQICANFEDFEARLEEFELGDTDKQEENKELVLRFHGGMGGSVVNSSIVRKEVSYTTNIQVIKLLDEEYLCIYLYDQKITEKANYSPRSSRLVRPKRKDCSVDLLTDDIPAERDESPTSPLRFERIRTTDSALLSPTSSLLKRFTWKKLTVLNSLTRRNEETQAMDPLLSPVSNISRLTKNTSIELLKPEDQREQRRSLIFKDIAKTAQRSAVKREMKIKGSAAGGSMTSSERRDANGKLEQAIHMVPEQKSLNVLSYLIGLFGMLCMGLIILHLVDGYEQLGVITQKIELMMACQRRTFSLVSSNINTRVLALITMGAISETRQIGLGIPMWSAAIKNTFSTHVTTLNVFNGNISERLYILSEEAQNKIHGIRVVLKDSGSERTVTLFEMFTEVANADNRIIRTPIKNISISNPTVRFVLDNTLNDPLIVSDYVIDILKDDYEDHLYSIRNEILSLFTITSVTGICIIGLLIRDIRKFITKRNQFIEMLLKINESALQDHVRIVTRFDNSLQKNMFNLQSYIEIKEHFLSTVKNYDTRAFRRKSRIRSKKGINFQIIKNMIFTVTALAIFVSAFMVLTITFQYSLDEFMSKRDRMIKTNSLRTDMILQNACVLAYISEKNTTMIRNMPLTTELNNIFALSEDIPDFLNRFLDDPRGMNMTLLQGIIHGDICDVVILPAIPSSVCKKITAIMGAHGLILTTKYFVDGQAETVRMFDSSNQTVADALVAYGIKPEVLSEQISSFTLKSAEILENIFKDDLKDSVIIYRQEVITIITVYAVVYVILGAFLLLVVLRSIKKERRVWRKIIRQIPFSIIASNKSLKAYLINDCDHILDSFKNLI